MNPEYRNRGIGYKIVELLLKDIKTRGIETTLLIASSLGEPIYTKAGFRKVSDYHYFTRDHSQEAKQFSDNIQPYKNDFYKDIIRLDTSISGENRERLLINYLHKSYVFVCNNVINGFYVPDLGEGPVFAETVEAGRELMRYKYSTVDKATIPGENQTGIEFLKEIGFVENNIKGKRMMLGKDIAWKPEMVYSRIGGNLG